MTLIDASEVYYQMSAVYHPEADAGVRWNDPAFGIEWLRADVIISERDSNYAPWQVPEGSGKGL